jgi:thymidylate synthase (FAD)
LFIEHWGNDERIVESARMSTDKGFLGWGPLHAEDCEFKNTAVLPADCGCKQRAGDEKLLAFLYTNKHSTPFEFAGLTIEIQAPIFVFREWHRHRTQSYSELSARYTPMPNANYVPTVDRLMVVNTANKQASTVKGSEVLTLDAALSWLTELQNCYDECERVYQRGLAIGVPKELARLPVPVARYSRMRATANLRNWLGFLTLRTAPNAQWEIREYAARVGDLVKVLYPRTWELFQLEREATLSR